MSWRDRQNGERTFERHGWLGRDRNPHDQYGSYDETQARRDWNEGFRAAERRAQERREEQEREEEREHEAMLQRARERAAEEEAMYAAMEAQRDGDAQ